MALSLKPGETHLLGKRVLIETGMIALLGYDVVTRILNFGLFIDKDTFTQAAMSKSLDVFALERFYITMSPEHFAKYLYTIGTYTARPLDIMNSQFNLYLLTEKPPVSGSSPYLDWNQWQEDSVPGIPLSAPGKIKE